VTRANPETRYTAEPVCPQCGKIQKDAYEIGAGHEGEHETDCDSCSTTFVVYRHVSWTYTTKVDYCTRIMEE